MLLMLQFGVANGEDIVRWADSQIIALDSPPESLIDLSTTPPSQIADQLTYLHALASGADYWAAFRRMLGHLHDYLAANPGRAQDIANGLFRTAERSPMGDLPKDLSFVYRIDEAFSLANDGIYGKPEAVLRDFLSELAKFKGEVMLSGTADSGPLQESPASSEIRSADSPRPSSPVDRG